MAVDGLTLAQVSRLLELSKLHRKPCNVKTVDKDIRSKPGRAILMSIDGKKAVIKPFKHRHTETVDLSTIRLWKGGCDFDISEVQNMNNAVLPFRPTQTKPTEVVSYVIFSKKKGAIWGGEQQKWGFNFHNAATFLDQNLGTRTVGRLRCFSDSNDAELLPRDKAYEALKEAESLRIKPSQTMPKPSSVIETKPSEDPTKLPSEELLASSTSSITDAELDAILNFDQTPLIKAVEAVKASHAKLMEARKNLEAIETQLQTDMRNYKTIVSILKSPQIEDRIEDNPNKGIKRGSLRRAVREILTESSRLDTKSLVQKVAGKVSTTESSIKQCFYSMRAQGDLEKDNSGNWSLTSKGRAASQPDETVG